VLGGQLQVHARPRGLGNLHGLVREQYHGSGVVAGVEGGVEVRTMAGYAGVVSSAS
jgi:GH25 family lysozyme M1 (1,4-beta-N-acetylmuramidase)